MGGPLPNSLGSESRDLKSSATGKAPKKSSAISLAPPDCRSAAPQKWQVAWYCRAVNTSLSRGHTITVRGYMYLTGKCSDWSVSMVPKVEMRGVDVDQALSSASFGFLTLSAVFVFYYVSDISNLLYVVFRATFLLIL
jgi:hypothetical protein